MSDLPLLTDFEVKGVGVGLQTREGIVGSWFMDC